MGHGAPDASQVCGLNLSDFQQLLDVLERELSLEFLIYETCFGGGKNQLREIYKSTQDAFKKFSFPIISCSITNSVSFAPHPSQGVSFKGLFAKVNNSMIMEKKMRRLLKAVNELNKCLDFASHYHWSNNLLLMRMPDSEFFEPVADNKSVFKLSEVSSLNEKAQKYAKSDEFKCVLVDKPVIKQSVDLSNFENFMVASGISRSKQYIKELKLPTPRNYWGNGTIEPRGALEQLAVQFSSLAYPQKEKKFFIDRLSMGSDLTFDSVTISLVPISYYSYFAKIKIDALHGSSYYTGEVEIDLEYPDNRRNNIYEGSKYQESSYIQSYTTAVKKHLNKKHQLPFGLSSLLGVII